VRSKQVTSSLHKSIFSNSLGPIKLSSQSETRSDLTLFIRLFQGSSMAVKAVHFFKVTAVVFQWLHLDLTAGPHPRFLVQSHILSADAPSSSKMVEKTEQNTLFKTSPEKRLYKSKKPWWIRTRKKRQQVLAAFHLVMWERALRTVTYSTSSTTIFSNESRWKSALQVAHLLFHNDNESEKALVWLSTFPLH